jgi:hypothetical protein
MIEESISVYKQDIFWDNLIISMSSLSNLLNEDKAHMPIVFAIQSEELEQILESSQKIDALNLDPSLSVFLQQCFTIKDKIRSYFEFSFGRHFIFTISETYEYCLLLINDDLINKFGCSSSSSIANRVWVPANDRRESMPFVSSSNPRTSPKKSEKQLDSFVLLKFNKKSKETDLWQVNRVQQAANKKSTTGNNVSRSFESGGSTVGSGGEVSSSFKNEKFYAANNLEKVMGSNKYLSFVVNNLMYVLWESLFIQD